MRTQWTDLKAMMDRALATEQQQVPGRTKAERHEKMIEGHTQAREGAAERHAELSSSVTHHHEEVGGVPGGGEGAPSVRCAVHRAVIVRRR